MCQCFCFVFSSIRSAFFFGGGGGGGGGILDYVNYPQDVGGRGRGEGARGEGGREGGRETQASV